MRNHARPEHHLGTRRNQHFRSPFEADELGHTLAEQARIGRTALEIEASRFIETGGMSVLRIPKQVDEFEDRQDARDARDARDANSDRIYAFATMALLALLATRRSAVRQRIYEPGKRS